LRPNAAKLMSAIGSGPFRPPESRNPAADQGSSPARASSRQGPPEMEARRAPGCFAGPAMGGGGHASWSRLSELKNRRSPRRTTSSGTSRHWLRRILRIPGGRVPRKHGERKTWRGPKWRSTIEHVSSWVTTGKSPATILHVFVSRSPSQGPLNRSSHVGEVEGLERPVARLGQALRRAPTSPNPDAGKTPGPTNFDHGMLDQ